MADLSFFANIPYVLKKSDTRVQRLKQSHCQCEHAVEFDVSGVFEHADMQLAHLTPTWSLCAEHTERWKDTAPHCGCYTTEHVWCGGHYVDVTHHRCFAHDLVMQLEGFITDERKHRRERIRTMRSIARFMVPCDIRMPELLFDTDYSTRIPLFCQSGCTHCKLICSLELKVSVVTHANADLSKQLQRVPCIAPVLTCARCNAATTVTHDRVYCVDAAGHQLCRECQPEPNANFVPLPHDEGQQARVDDAVYDLHYVIRRVQVSAANVPCPHCQTPNKVTLTCSVVSNASGVVGQLLRRLPCITPILDCAHCRREEPATPFQLFYDQGGYRHQMFCAACTEHSNRTSVAQHLLNQTH